MQTFRNWLDRVSEHKSTLVVILLLCLILRLGMAAREGKKPLTGDEITYTQIALHIARGDGFQTGPIEHPEKHRPTAWGNAVYPFFLGGIYRVFGFNVLAVLVIQSLLDTLTCLFIFSLALKTTKSRPAANVAAFFYALYPPFIIATSWVYTEALSSLLLTAAVYLYWISSTRRARVVAAAGATMGIIILLRPAMLLFPVFALLGFWLLRREDSAWLAKGALYVVMSYLVVSPWTIRNYMVVHAFVPVSTHGGLTFYGGTGVADGAAMPNPAGEIAVRGTKEPISPDCFLVSKATYDKMMALRDRIRVASEREQDAIYREAALKEIREHPGRYALQAVKKFVRLWFNVLYDSPQTKPSLVDTLLTIARPRPIMNFGLLLLGVLGALMPSVDRRFTQFVLLQCVYISLVCMAIYSVSRYSWPLFPFIIILAAAFIAGRPVERKASDADKLTQAPASSPST